MARPRLIPVDLNGNLAADDFKLLLEVGVIAKLYEFELEDPDTCTGYV